MSTAKSGLDTGLSAGSVLTGPLSGGFNSLTSLAKVPTINLTGYLGTLCSKEQPLVDSTLKVATLSVWWRHHDYEKREKSIISELKALNADVICLQDVWKEVDKDGKSQTQTIAEGLGYKFVFEGKSKATDAAGKNFKTARYAAWAHASSAPIRLSTWCLTLMKICFSLSTPPD